MSVSGSQVFSLVLMAVDGRSAGKNNLKDVVCVPAALLLLFSGLRETDPKDMVSEAPGDAGCCQGSFRQSLVFVKCFSQAQCFCFMATLVVSGVFRICTVGEWQLGSCIMLFLSAASQRAGETAFVCGFVFLICFMGMFWDFGSVRQVRSSLPLAFPMLQR